VALKVMVPAAATNPSARQRFLREARAVAAIEHDHIVRINQVGEDRGVPFFAMPLLRGETLDALLRRAGTLPIDEALRIGREIALGLAAAHAQGLIHRDIKPANIWLEASGTAPRAKLLDFGLARVTPDAAPLTEPGALLGTPAWMAPEQALGKPLDHRCDLFSLGSVLYRMCTGEAPFKRNDTLLTLEALVRDQPRPPREINPQVPPGLAELITQLLAKEPEGRPPSASVVAMRLETIEHPIGPGAPQLPVPGRIEERRAIAMSETATVARPPLTPAALPPAAPRRSSRLGCWLAAAGWLAALGLAIVAFGPAIYGWVERQRPVEGAVPPVEGVVPPVVAPDQPDSLLKGALLVFAFEKEDFFKKGADTYVRDLSGRGNDGLCEDVVATPNGKAGGGLKCSGAGAVHLPGSLFNRRANYTVTAWINLSDDERVMGELGDLFVDSLRAKESERVFGVTLARDGNLFCNAWNWQREKEAGDFWQGCQARGVVQVAAP
jgi:hypothetical protein